VREYIEENQLNHRLHKEHHDDDHHDLQEVEPGLHRVGWGGVVGGGEEGGGTKQSKAGARGGERVRGVGGWVGGCEGLCAVECRFPESGFTSSVALPCARVARRSFFAPASPGSERAGGFGGSPPDNPPLARFRCRRAPSCVRSLRAQHLLRARFARTPASARRSTGRQVDRMMDSSHRQT
jgi:hypothetical protein